MSTLFSYAPQLNLTTRNVEPPAARSKSGLTLARPNEAGKSNFF
jgi:hypothetical protein